MGTTYSWIGEGAEIPHLGEEVIDDFKFNRFRGMFDRSHLLERAAATCTSFNLQAGEVLIYSEIFTDTHPVMGRYVIEEEHSSFTMEIAILSDGPGVVFSSRKSRPWVKKFQRYCGYRPGENSRVVCKLNINPSSVSDAEIQQWFTYLLSGLHHSLKPEPMEPLMMKSWMGAVRPSVQLSK